VLLSCIKPILAHLSSPNPNPSSSSGEEEEELSGEAKDAIRHYMDLLDVRPFYSRTFSLSAYEADQIGREEKEIRR
jgi:hypothetical protein